MVVCAATKIVFATPFIKSGLNVVKVFGGIVHHLLPVLLSKRIGNA
jgi:hypothetical protein